MSLFEEALEKLLLEKWSHTKSKDKDMKKSLFSCGKSILQVRGCIHKENVIVYINPSCKQKFINIQLVNRLQVLINNIQSTQVAGENFKLFKDLKLSMDIYVLYSYFEALDMDD
jgi:hypothetical protein